MKLSVVLTFRNAKVRPRVRAEKLRAKVRGSKWGYVETSETIDIDILKKFRSKVLKICDVNTTVVSFTFIMFNTTVSFSPFLFLTMSTKVYLDIHIGTALEGRVVFELFSDRLNYIFFFSDQCFVFSVAQEQSRTSWHLLMVPLKI